MLTKLENLQRIIKTGIVAIVRTEYPENALKIVEAIKKGGIDIIEVTFTVPSAHRVLEELSKRYDKEEILLGAGTILDSETARIAMLSGAEFFVSPSFDSKVAIMCNRYQKIYMPGCKTPKEMILAMESGVEIIKYFPGNDSDPSIVKALKGPLPQAALLPTGGVSISNAGDWIRNGSIAIGVGGELIAGAKSGDFDAVTETAKEFYRVVNEARS